MANHENLSDLVAVVTGATRGAGRGIAVELGAAGATVYVTGRTSRAAPATTYAKFMASAGMSAMPGTVEDTADEVTRAGGRGVAVVCDHTREADVRALVARVIAERRRLDLLVNNAWGGHESFTPETFGAPFWKQDLAQWDAFFDRGVRNHLLAAQVAAPIFVEQRRGLIVGTTYWDDGKYIAGDLLYDLAKASLVRLAFGLAEELRPHGVASLALSPGYMRTELVLAAHHTDEQRWREVPALARSETPRYIGRAVVALAADRDVMARSGRALQVGDLARAYGFTDVDGRQPEPFRL